jgi:hypothetical protein
MPTVSRDNVRIRDSTAPRLQPPPLQDSSVNLSYVLKTFVAGIDMDTERCPDPEPAS